MLVTFSRALAPHRPMQIWLALVITVSIDVGTGRSTEETAKESFTLGQMRMRRRFSPKSFMNPGSPSRDRAMSARPYVWWLAALGLLFVSTQAAELPKASLGWSLIHVPGAWETNGPPTARQYDGF